MAKVQGPLFSQEASGKFANTVVFARRRGQNVARSYVTPANPMTDNQIAVRITLAVIGIITRQVNAGDWAYTGEAMSFIEFLRSTVRTGEVWNSAYGRLMIGPGRATYTDALTAYLALASGITDLWDAAAATAITNLPGYTRGTTTITGGFQLYLAELAIANAGYGEAFVPATPVTVITAP